MSGFFNIFLIFVFSLAIRLYRLDILPGEWYGDISNVHEYVTEIFKGRWPFYFLQSPGPVYHYFIAPFILLLKLKGYEAYKFSSVFVSLISLLAIYLFAREAFNKKIAVLTLLIASFSLWFLIWSRLGNSQIIIPAEVALSGFFLIRFFNRKKIKDLILSLLTASFGWYTYPQTFILPVFIFIFLLTYLFLRLKFSPALKHSALALAVFLIGLLPMLFIIKNQAKGMAGNFSSTGYVGSKVLPVLKLKKGEFISKLSINMAKTLLMFNVRGDNSFRVNIAGHTQLDKISGFLLLIGLIYLYQKKRHYFWLFVISFLVLSLPSVSPAIPDAEIPNSARTIGVIPFVYTAVALGFYQLFIIIKKKFRAFSTIFFTVVFMLIAFINIKDYFFVYSSGLPDDNLGPSNIIASFLDKKVPRDYKLYFAECCWGNYGQPEPKGIAYSLKKSRAVDYSRLITGCSDFDYFPLAIVTRHEDKFKNEFTACISGARQMKIYSRDGIFISNLYLLEE